MDLFFSSSASSLFLYSSYKPRTTRRSLGQCLARCERLLTIAGTTESQLVEATDWSTHADHTETENTKHLDQRVRASTPCECFQYKKFLFIPTTKHYPCATNALQAGIISWSVGNTRDSVESTCITEVRCKYDQVIKELLPSHNTNKKGQSSVLQILPVSERQQTLRARPHGQQNLPNRKHVLKITEYLICVQMQSSPSKDWVIK